jgi:hypothetical protein
MELTMLFADTIDTISREKSSELFLIRIEAEGWFPKKFDHWEIVCWGCYSSESHGEEGIKAILEQIDTAFKCSVDLSFHIWPIEDE